MIKKKKKGPGPIKSAAVLPELIKPIFFKWLLILPLPLPPNPANSETDFRINRGRDEINVAMVVE